MRILRVCQAISIAIVLAETCTDIVTPAKAGVQNILKRRDIGLRQHDE
jgi:hypothetical protein